MTSDARTPWHLTHRRHDTCQTCDIWRTTCQTCDIWRTDATAHAKPVTSDAPHAKPVTSDAQTPRHMPNLWHLTHHMPNLWHLTHRRHDTCQTCDIWRTTCQTCDIVALHVVLSVVTDTCRWVLLYNVDCVTQARQNNIDLINSMLRSSIRFIASQNSFVQQIFLC